MVMPPWSMRPTSGINDAPAPHMFGLGCARSEIVASQQQVFIQQLGVYTWVSGFIFKPPASSAALLYLKASGEGSVEWWCVVVVYKATKTTTTTTYT